MLSLIKPSLIIFFQEIRTIQKYRFQEVSIFDLIMKLQEYKLTEFRCHVLLECLKKVIKRFKQ